MIIMMILMILILLLSVVFHELGHYLYFRLSVKKKVEIRFYHENKKFGIKIGWPLDYMTLKDRQRYDIYIWGVNAGALILLIFIFINPVFGFLMPVYFIGCISDLTNAWRILKNVKQQQIA